MGKTSSTAFCMISTLGAVMVMDPVEKIFSVARISCRSIELLIVRQDTGCRMQDGKDSTY